MAYIRAHGVVSPQTLDVHRSDLRDAIYAKIEKSIYRGAGIARPYITTYIRAPGMGKQDHPLPGVVYPPQTLDLHRSDLGDAIYAKIEKSIYMCIYTGQLTLFDAPVWPTLRTYIYI